MNTHRILILTTFAAPLLLAAGITAAGAGDWERRQLFQPSPALLERERSGQVTIYDGLLVSDVERAMDEQFDRVGAMMFVRTRHPAPEGEGEYEEDEDCD